MAAAGTDTAIETADVALMDDDPRKLAEFVRLSRSTKTVLWQNIVFALGLKWSFNLGGEWPGHALDGRVCRYGEACLSWPTACGCHGWVPSGDNSQVIPFEFWVTVSS
jgi:hypothetical protein